jgi:hypothetical protein
MELQVDRDHEKYTIGVVCCKLNALVITDTCYGSQPT